MTEVKVAARGHANRPTYSEKNKVAEHFIGGNRLSNAPSSKVKDFVAQNDGHTVITNVRGLSLEESDIG